LVVKNKPPILDHGRKGRKGRKEGKDLG